MYFESILSWRSCNTFIKFHTNRSECKCSIVLVNLFMERFIINMYQQAKHLWWRVLWSGSCTFPWRQHNPNFLFLLVDGASFSDSRCSALQLGHTTFMLPKLKSVFGSTCGWDLSGSCWLFASACSSRWAIGLFLITLENIGRSFLVLSIHLKIVESGYF